MVARKITVVQMLPELESGGVESVTLETAAFLADQGHKSIVISGGGKMADQLISEGSHHLTWHHIGEKSPRCLKYILPLRKLLAAEQVDILHLRSRLPAWVGYIAWKSLPEKGRSRLVTTFHGFYSVNPYSEIMTKGEKVIAISKAIADHINTKYDIDDDRIAIIPEGINENLFSANAVSKERTDKLSERWNFDSTDSPTIMLPGRITRLKGHDVFIKALTKIKHLQWNAVCVGGWDQKSSYYNELVDLVLHSELTQRINFTGDCTDMPAAYMLSDIIVSASKKPESFGRTSVEAQSMGKMVIATAHGGSLETVLHNKTGLLVKPDHVDHLSEALKVAINRIPLDMNTVNTTRSWVVENFTLSRMCRDTLKLYESILH